MIVFEILFIIAIAYEIIMLILANFTMHNKKKSDNYYRRAFNRINVIYVVAFIVITKAFNIDLTLFG